MQRKIKSQSPIPHRIIILLRRRLLNLPRAPIYRKSARKSATTPNQDTEITKRIHVHTRLSRIRNSPSLPLPPIPIISHIPRSKNAIQQPPSNPIGSILAIGNSTIKQRPRRRRCVAPDLENRPALSVWSDVVPEERRACVWVCADVIEEVGGVLVDAVVDHYCFVLRKGV